jgi:hypothetical protein
MPAVYYFDIYISILTILRSVFNYSLKAAYVVRGLLLSSGFQEVGDVGSLGF